MQSRSAIPDKILRDFLDAQFQAQSLFIAWARMPKKVLEQPSCQFLRQTEEGTSKKIRNAEELPHKLLQARFGRQNQPWKAVLNPERAS
jgi:hypothetical protein